MKPAGLAEKRYTPVSRSAKDGRLLVPPPGKRDAEFMLSWPTAINGTSPAYPLPWKVRALPGHTSSSTEWLGRIPTGAVRGRGCAIGCEGCATRMERNA